MIAGDNVFHANEKHHQSKFWCYSERYSSAIEKATILIVDTGLRIAYDSVFQIDSDLPHFRNTK